MIGKVSIFSVLFLCLVAVCLPGCRSYPSGPAADEILSDPSGFSVVERKGYIALLPEVPKETAVLFYPGGRVDETAYLPLLELIVKKGYPVYLSSMPFDLAVLKPGRGRTVQDENRHSKWILMGHSLGGAVLSRQWQKGRILGDAIVFLASYPVDSMVYEDIPVLALFGEKDGVIGPGQRRDKIALMPSSATVEIIPGGNHAGFGDYGPQNKDGEADINKEEQWKKAVELILEFIVNSPRLRVK